MTQTDWKKYKFSALGKIITGKTPSTKKGQVFGAFVPFLTPTDITNQRKITCTARFLSQEGLSLVKNCLLPSNSICVTCIGSDMGKTVIADRDIITNQQINSIIINADIAVPLYVYYAFRARKQEFLALGLAGSTMPILNKTTFSDLEINLPPIEEQKRIAQILGALDDKIELLQKQNKTLEDMAKAIFKSWFVDFDVVYAKQKGLPKADIMREYHLTDELYDLFPSDFENSSLGPIPLGWQATTFKTITTQEKTRVGSQELPVLSAVKTGELVLSEDFFNKKVFSNSIKNYIVVPRLSFAYNPSRINIGSIGCNHMNSAGCVSPVYVVFSVISGYENYMEFIIHSTSFSSEVAHRASGTVRQSLSYQDLSYIPVIKPSKDIISMFDTLISYWQQKQILNNKQIQTLTELRDTLLPPLISGKIRV